MGDPENFEETNSEAVGNSLNNEEVAVDTDTVVEENVKDHHDDILAASYGMTLEQMNQLLWFVKVIEPNKEIKGINDLCEYSDDGRVILKHDIIGERIKDEIRFPEDMTVEGYFHLTDCPNFTEFSEGFKVGKDVSISGTGIKCFPDSMNVIQGELNASYCLELESIVQNTIVDGYCDFSNDVKLKSIHGLVANEGLSLYGCKNVKDLLSQITFAYEVTLSKDVPEEVKVYAEELMNSGVIYNEIIYA